MGHGFQLLQVIGYLLFGFRCFPILEGNVHKKHRLTSQCNQIGAVDFDTVLVC